MSKTVMPDAYKRNYSCPRCGVLCPQDPYRVDRKFVDGQYSLTLFNLEHKISIPRVGGGVRFKTDAENGGKSSRPPKLWDLMLSLSSECREYTVWENENVIFPFTNEMPKPEEYMPEDVSRLYDEAAQVFKYSPRASAALLRIGIETLLIQHLGLKKDTINNMIKELVEKGVPEHIQKGLDVLRYYGNQGAHLGEIDLNDNREKVEFLFKLINMLVKELITKQKEIDSFYDSLPESFRTHVEKRDTVKK